MSTNSIKDLFTAVPVSQENFENHVDKTFEEMSSILKEKNRMYGGASMDLGMVGNYVHLYDKVSRLRTLVNIMFSEVDRDLVSFEGIEDTLRDIIGYATIGLAILNEQNSDSKKEKVEYVEGYGYAPLENLGQESPFGYEEEKDN